MEVLLPQTSWTASVCGDGYGIDNEIGLARSDNSELT